MPTLKQQVKAAKENSGEASFAYVLRTIGRDLPTHKREWRIPEDAETHDDQNCYRADFAWPKQRVIVEIEGQVHCIASQFAKDCVRQCWLSYWNYRVFRITPQQVRNNPHTLIKMLREILKGGNDE